MENKSQYGTNGRFSDATLFNCADGQGVLIPLNKVEECCVNRSHRHVPGSNDDMIAGSCICCAETRAQLPYQEGIQIGSRVIRDNHNRSFSGTCRWIGLVNGVEVIGVEMTNTKHDHHDDCLDRMNLFECPSNKRAIFRSQGFHQDVPDKLKCDELNIDVINPTKISVLCNKKPLCVDIVIRGQSNPITIEARCIGTVGSKDLAGCVLPFDYKHGTDGTFMGQHLFQCDKNRGVLVAKESFPYRCLWDGHFNLKSTTCECINENEICCFQCKENSPIKIGSDVIITLDNKRYAVKCLWSGLINGKEAIGVEMNHKLKHSTDGTFMGKKLFNIQKGSGIIATLQSLKYKSDLALTKNIYLENDVDITNVERLPSDKKDLVCIQDVPCIYGRVIFSMTLMGHSLKGVNICDEYSKGVNKRYVHFPDPCLVIVISDSINPFHGQFNYLENSNIIDTKSIKVRECYESTEINKDDIVKYGGGLGRVVDFKLMNDIRCVGVKNSISMSGDEVLKYIEEDRATKIDDFVTKSLELTIIDPRSVAICTRALNDDFKVGDEVETKLPKKGINFQGKIKLIVDVNNSSLAAIVELKSPSSTDLPDYQINGLPEFNDFMGSNRNDVIIVNLNTIQAYQPLADCPTNNVTVLKSLSVKGHITGTLTDKIITFRCHQVDIIARLLWIGKINGKNYIGCEMGNKSQYGTNGTFADATLFNCADGQGVLIPLDKVEECCVNRSHKHVPGSNDDMIAGSCICCAETRARIQYQEGIQIGSRVIRNNHNGSISGTCRWIGLVNGVEVIGVKMTNTGHDHHDDCLDRMHLFDCPSNKRAIFRSQGFHQECFMEMVIPEDDRPFKEININTAVVYYHPVNNKMQPMYGTVKWSGREETDGYMYGIELDDRCDGGTDGVFKGQRLFKCQDGHGIISSIDVVAPDERFTEPNFKDDDIIKSPSAENARLSMPVKLVRGENIGIQGNANSCYFDSSIFALFSKSDVLDFMITDALNETEKNGITKKFREIMAWQIIYPLRESGLVTFHHTKEMRDVIVKYGGQFREMNKHETDMENVSALLAMLCPDEQLLSLRAFTGHCNKGMFLQLFVILNKAVKNITSQQMLDLSMAQNGIMFDKPPTCLIMQAPRDARGINCYENVLPSRIIEISNLCRPYRKDCYKCEIQATYQCKTCIEDCLEFRLGLYCENHKCRHSDLERFDTSDFVTNNEVQMQLKAIICIEKAHFVAYVKEDEFLKEWVFFDSMSTQNTTNNYAVPKVSSDDFITKFLNSNTGDMKHELEGYANDARLKRIIKDSYIFVYHNSSQTCY